MKRTIIILTALLSLFLMTAAPASAAASDLVTDGAGVLTNEEYYELNDIALQVTMEYECEVGVFVAEDIGGDDAYEYAKQVYQFTEFGYGIDRSGILLFLNLAGSDAVLVAYGYGNDAFTDYGKNVLLERYVVPLLAKGLYYDAFKTYLDKAAEFLEMADAGAPFDRGTDEAYQEEGASGGRVAATVIIPLVIALIVCLIFRSQMKTARQQRKADNYIPSGGVNITGGGDYYLYSSQTRRKIEENTSGGGGTTKSRDGFSGSSKKF